MPGVGNLLDFLHCRAGERLTAIDWMGTAEFYAVILRRIMTGRDDQTAITLQMLNGEIHQGRWHFTNIDYINPGTAQSFNTYRLEAG